ncbi:hypothetical protein GCM10023175_28220 [Pseudonocardia xishanensis]|uniref:Insertion element IS402-like domain-containing protein n=1 Tax=Pseudonocardia xishanensis TaxID=630995 RepID=A0ABP8RT77_9PSEU
MVGRGELTDRAWARIEPLLPAVAGNGRRRRDHRQVINAILWKLRTGAPWRDLPERYGPWKTAPERLRRWTADGTWDRILDEAVTKDDSVGAVERPTPTPRPGRRCAEAGSGSPAPSARTGSPAAPRKAHTAGAQVRPGRLRRPQRRRALLQPHFRAEITIAATILWLRQDLRDTPLLGRDGTVYDFAAGQQRCKPALSAERRRVRHVRLWPAIPPPVAGLAVPVAVSASRNLRPGRRSERDGCRRSGTRLPE